jgi:integrase
MEVTYNMPRQKKQHLKRQKDGRFYCSYLGKMFSGSTEEEALQKREDFKRSKTVRTDQTVGEYAMYWLPIHKAGVKATTYNSYVSVITKAVKPIANIRLSKLTTDDVSEAFAALSDKSASYIHKAKVLLTEILDSATDAGYLAKNPVRAQSVKPPKGKKGTHRAITDAERTQINRTPHRMQLAALLMLYCGLRRGEVIGLQAQDIQGESLTVRRAVYYVSNQPMISTPKTANGIRTVPFPDFLVHLIPKMNRNCYLLTGTQKPMTEQVFTRAWSNFCTEAGVEIRCHDLRHSYCTWLRDTGIDIHQAIIWMGHADEKLILRIYDHPGTERETSAKNLLKTAFDLQNDLRKSDEPSKTSATPTL